MKEGSEKLTFSWNEILKVKLTKLVESSGCRICKQGRAPQSQWANGVYEFFSAAVTKSHSSGDTVEI